MPFMPLILLGLMVKSNKDFYSVAVFENYSCALLVNTPLGMMERRLVLSGELPLDELNSPVQLAVTEAAKQMLGTRLRECKVVCAHRFEKPVPIKRKKKQSPLVFGACLASISRVTKTIFFDFFTIDAESLADWQQYEDDVALLDVVCIAY